MKRLQRYLLVLLCCTMLLTAYSPIVNAAELDGSNYNVTFKSYVNASGWALIGESFFLHGDGQIYGDTFTKSLTTNGLTSVIFENNYFFSASKNGTLFKKGETATVTANNLFYFGMVYDDNSFTLNIAGTPLSTDSYAVVYYIDGTTERVSLDVVQRSNGNFDVTFTLTASKDVSYINFVLRKFVDFGRTLRNFTVGSYVGEKDDTFFGLNIDVVPQEVSLLDKIKNGIGDLGSKLTSGFSELGSKLTSGFSELGSKLTSGFSELGNKLTSGFSDLKNGLTNLFNSIKELPSKLWGLIEDGLKGLFIPDEEFMTDYKTKWESSLADKLGAVWQASNVIFGAWDSVMEADEQDMISMPEVTIPLPDNETFSFGGFDVPIVPEGFDVLVTAVKSIVGIGFTLMFINGLRKRYESIMGG